MTSLVVFSPDVRRLAVFYEVVLGATSHSEPSGDIRLLSERDEVLVHSIPDQVAKSIHVTSPPVPRQNSPLKPVFDVASLEVALERVEPTGGVVTSRVFSLNGLTRHDVVDPDGNVIQLRSPNS
jgi:predicted enzyme related to lactoylglutathione lyase